MTTEWLQREIKEKSEEEPTASSSKAAWIKQEVSDNSMTQNLISNINVGLKHNSANARAQNLTSNLNVAWKPYRANRKA